MFKHVDDCGRMWVYAVTPPVILAPPQVKPKVGCQPQGGGHISNEAEDLPGRGPPTHRCALRILDALPPIAVYMVIN
jgi:hypothetical protein